MEHVHYKLCMINKVMFNVDLKYEPSQWADQKHLEGAAVDRVVAVMGVGRGGNLQDEAVGLRSGRVRLRRRGIRGVTVLEGVAVDGGGVGEGGGEHCHRGPPRVQGNPSRAGVNLQDDELGLRGGRVRGRRRVIRGLPCWTKAPPMEAGSGKEAEVTVTAGPARRTA